jgi:phenylacetate-coenzyme A ligase PaaK-like adenylate-forming protein
VPLIEYGMMETGAMAYSSPQCSALTFIWDAFHCHANSDRELIVTSLQPMRFPLINYGTEDQIEPLDGVASLPYRCARISGRIGYVFQLKTRSGKMMEVNGELILNVLDVISEVYAFEIHQGEQMLDIAVQLAPNFEVDVIRGQFLREIKREIPNLDESTITFSQLGRRHQTISGKHQVVVFR